jgi:hypothetical protein
LPLHFTGSVSENDCKSIIDFVFPGEFAVLDDFQGWVTLTSERHQGTEVLKNQ